MGKAVCAEIPLGTLPTKPQALFLHVPEQVTHCCAWADLASSFLRVPSES